MSRGVLRIVDRVQHDYDGTLTRRCAPGVVVMLRILAGAHLEHGDVRRAVKLYEHAKRAVDTLDDEH